MKNKWVHKNKYIALLFLLFYILVIFLFSFIYSQIYDQFYYSSLKNESYGKKLEGIIEDTFYYNLYDFYKKGNKTLPKDEVFAKLEILNNEYQESLKNDRASKENQLPDSIHVGTYFSDIDISDLVATDRNFIIELEIYYYDYFFEYTENEVILRSYDLMQRAALTRYEVVTSSSIAGLDDDGSAMVYSHDPNKEKNQIKWYAEYRDNVEGVYLPKILTDDVVAFNYFELENDLSKYIDDYKQLVLKNIDYDTIPNRFLRTLYLSMVTITTLGYGDIIPLTTLSRTLIGIEAVLGVIIPGIFVSILFRKSR